MFVSVFDIFKIGIGPSSSHTVGPMVAAKNFCEKLFQNDEKLEVSQLKIILYGSLAYTGVGHSIEKAIILGLHGILPDQTDLNKSKIFIDSCVESKK